MILKGASYVTQSMKQSHGPGNFITNTIHPNPMKIVTLDEAEPFYLINNQGEHEKFYKSMV